jgi:hypothetical protein
MRGSLDLRAVGDVNAAALQEFRELDATMRADPIDPE